LGDLVRVNFEENRVKYYWPSVSFTTSYVCTSRKLCSSISRPEWHKTFIEGSSWCINLENVSGIFLMKECSFQ